MAAGQEYSHLHRKEFLPQGWQAAPGAQTQGQPWPRPHVTNILVGMTREMTDRHAPL